MELTVLFVFCVAISGVAIRLSSALARRLGVMDEPGEHKQHGDRTPFVGGVGIMVVLLSIFPLADLGFSRVSLDSVGAIGLVAVVIFLTGLADDVWHLAVKPRLLVQAIAALLMVFVGGVELRSFGELLPGVTLDLGLLGVPLTVFATIGLINALNMIDGIDGLSGSVSLVSLGLIALIAHHGHNATYFVLLVALMGGVVGFLGYNLRYAGNSRARVFLGDNGSMLLGFVFAWSLIALSQATEGRQPAMTPVTALWLFALPLMDTVGVMLRRIWLGKSPFRADRYHLHHLFIRAGFRVCDIVALAVVMQCVFGLVGVGGLWLGVPEYVMFWLFVLAFAAYAFVIARPWRLVPWLRRLSRRLGLPSVEVRGIFVGYFRQEAYREVVGVIAAGLGRGYDYQISVYRAERSAGDGRNVYCLVHIPVVGSDHLIGIIHRDALRVRRRLLRRQGGVEVRLFLCRGSEPDPHESGASSQGMTGRSRTVDRRGMRSTLIYSTERGEGMGASDQVGFEVSVPPA